MSARVKDSGVEWIGQVPELWSVFPIKRSVSLRKDRRTDYPSSSVYIGLEDVESGTGKYAPTDGSSRQGEDSTVGIFDAGDVLYGKLRPYLRKSMTATFAGACSTEFLVMEPHKVLPAWLNLWLLTDEVTQKIEASCEGAKMPRADWESIGAVPMPVPAVTDQQSILGGLDRATTRIDALVAKKTRFIELLREKRQALITHAVTKGLDRDVAMKDSGVEWLGKVPAHWEVVPPGVLFTDSKERAHLGDEMLSATQKYGVIPLADFEALEQRQVTKATTNFEMRKHVEIGDFVISMRSMDGGLERSHATGSVRSSYSVLKAQSEVHGPYFGLLMKCSLFIQALRLTSNFIRDGQDLSFTHVKKVKLPLPDLAEQMKIAEHVDRATTRIDTLIAKTERSIELLREHRTALITAAVTGKIDLHN